MRSSFNFLLVSVFISLLFGFNPNPLEGAQRKRMKLEGPTKCQTSQTPIAKKINSAARTPLSREAKRAYLKRYEQECYSIFSSYFNKHVDPRLYTKGRDLDIKGRETLGLKGSLEINWDLLQEKNIFILDEKGSTPHLGAINYDHASRLVPYRKTDKNLSDPLSRAFPSKVWIEVASNKPLVFTEEIRIIRKIISLFPGASMLPTFKALYEPRGHKERAPFYKKEKGSSFVNKECPMNRGTLNSILTTSTLIEDLCTKLSKLPPQRLATRNLLLIRPPGHHAHENVGGFCFLNNVLWALRLSQKLLPRENFAIIDIDLHDGNGTIRGLTKKSKNAFMLNIFDKDVYPYGVTAYDPRVRENLRFLVDVPLPMGTKKAAYLENLKTGIKKLKNKLTNEPHTVFISAGFDTSRVDSETSFHNKGFALEEEDYAALFQEISHSFPKSHIVSLLEGGYHQKTLQESIIHAFNGFL